MNHALFLLAFCSAGLAGAQSTPSTLLWRVTPADGATNSYLYGTIHSQDERAFQFTDSVLPALYRSAVVAGELDLQQAGPAAMQLMQAALLPDGQKLPDLYRRKKDRERVTQALAERFGPMALMLQRVKPFYVMAMMTEGSMAQDRARMLDDELQTLARTNGQRVIGLETMAEQMAAMDALPLREQADLLLQQIKDDRGNTDLDAMLNAYERQDLDALFATMEGTGALPARMEKALFTDRNLRMVQRLDSMIRGGESVFFLVGAGHLPRPDGLISLLRQRGYRVEPVFAPIARREEQEEPEH